MAGNPIFGKKIRELREAKLKDNPKFTLRQFATAVGISPTFLSKVERGEFDPPAADKIIKMAVLLDVDPDELLAMVGKFDPELEKIIKENPMALPDLLRTVREVAPNCRTLQMLSFAAKLSGEGVTYDREIESQKAWWSSGVR